LSGVSYVIGTAGSLAFLLALAGLVLPYNLAILVRLAWLVCLVFLVSLVLLVVWHFRWLWQVWCCLVFWQYWSVWLAGVSDVTGVTGDLAILLILAGLVLPRILVKLLFLVTLVEAITYTLSTSGICFAKHPYFWGNPQCNTMFMSYSGNSGKTSLEWYKLNCCT
jgi:hypothetical protein